MLLSDYTGQIREIAHDLASVDWTDSELIGYVNNARQRVALDLHCVRTLITGLNLVANQETYPVTGGIGGYIVTNAGSGYTSPVVSVAAAPAGGVTATAIVPALNLVGGTITGILPAGWGKGYASTPNVTITDGGPGVGATATAIPVINILDTLSATVIWPGGLQSRMLQWCPFSEFQAWDRSYRGTTGYPYRFTQHAESNLLFYARVPDQAYVLELDNIALPTPLVNLTDQDLQVIQPNADCVQWWGAYLAILKLQNFGHANYLEKAYKTRMTEVRASKQDRRVRNIYAAMVRRQMRGG